MWIYVSHNIGVMLLQCAWSLREWCWSKFEQCTLQQTERSATCYGGISVRCYCEEKRVMFISVLSRTSWIPTVWCSLYAEHWERFLFTMLSDLSSVGLCLCHQLLVMYLCRYCFAMSSFSVCWASTSWTTSCCWLARRCRTTSRNSFIFSTFCPRKSSGDWCSQCLQHSGIVAK